MKIKPLKIVVAGLAGTFPMAGSAMSWLQYVYGLKELGHEVFYVEDTDQYIYTPENNSFTDEEIIAVRRLSTMMSSIGLDIPWVFGNKKGHLHGPGLDAYHEFMRKADMLIHVTGAMYIKEIYAKIPIRVYIDTDPGFIQMRVENGSKKDDDHLSMHTHFFTFAVNINKQSCNIPHVGRMWHPTRQPICLEMWPVVQQPNINSRFTTLVKWDAGGHTVNSNLHGKEAEFRRFIDLPLRTSVKLEIASLGNIEIKTFEEFGWFVSSGAAASASLARYVSYIGNSFGEFSVAKSAYVKSAGGWFSDRSCAYLACGRPAVLQSTGFESWLPIGAGLFAFNEVGEAVEALEVIMRDWKRQSLAARRIAECHFSSKIVLTDLLEAVLK